MIDVTDTATVGEVVESLFARGADRRTTLTWALVEQLPHLAIGKRVTVVIII